jgi:hypothetical protein
MSLTARLAAASDGDPRARAAEVLAQAERDDADLAFAKALAGYDEALRLDPSAASAARAEQRGTTIRARSEGDFAPLVALERVRRDPRLAVDGRAIDDLVRAAEGFPPGLVRVEAWVLAAEAYSSRLHRADDAVLMWRRIATDPHADAVVGRAAIHSLVGHHVARGDHAAASTALALRSPVDPDLAREVRRAARRHWLHLASIVVITTVVGLAAIAIARAFRAGRLAAVLARTRASGRLVLGYAAYVGIAGAVLATGYEDGTARPFLVFGAVLAPLLFLARAWGAAGSPTRSARGLRAALCASSALGAAFLSLEHVDVRYLESLGL